MSRIIFGSALLIVWLLGSCPAQAVVPDDKPAPPTPARVLQAKLAKPVTTPAIELNTPLKEALGFLAEKFGVPILIDVESYQNDLQIQEPENQPVKLPALTDVPLREVLRLLAGQCQATCVQRGNIVMVVPAARARLHAFGQPVDLDCKERSLDRVLAELADRTGCNIALDARRAGEAAKQPITLKLAGATLQDAVRLVADMAGLDVVSVDNTLYVTTKANARRLQPAADANASAPVVLIGGLGP